MSTTTITSRTGVRFLVRIVKPGEAFGATGSLVDLDHTLVEFYDTRYPHTEFGQFISRYRVETLLQETRTGGLVLATGIPAWTVDSAAMDLVRLWLRHEAEPVNMDRSYSTGIPVAVTVTEFGNVILDFDLSEIEDIADDVDLDEVNEAQVIADVAEVSRVVGLIKNHLQVTIEPDGTVSL